MADKAQIAMPEYPENLYLTLYREMFRIRAFEESLVRYILNGEIKTPCHLYTGQEGVAVGVCQALAEDDYVFGNHRSHGHYLAKGGDIKKLAAEIWGKKAGCCKGKGGSMHLIAPECGFMGATPIVGGTIGVALGAALAIKIKAERKVTVSFFGDGAAGEGVLYEALNFAALYKLPIIFVCENNFYSTHMPLSKCRVNDDICGIAEAFNVNYMRIDGNDVVSVFEFAQIAAEECRNDQGPQFVQCDTYRLRGHVGPDDNIQGEHTDIRPAEEVSKWRLNDPLTVFFDLYVDDEDDPKWRDLEKGIMREVEDAIEFARQTPWPPEAELRRDIYRQPRV